MNVQKIVTGLFAIALVTTAILPGRQTVPVVNALTNLFRGSLATAMGTGKAV